MIEPVLIIIDSEKFSTLGSDLSFKVPSISLVFLFLKYIILAESLFRNLFMVILSTVHSFIFLVRDTASLIV